jgi:protein O-GlcNAc transferase
MSDFLPSDLSNFDALLEEGVRYYTPQPDVEALLEYQRTLAMFPRDSEALIGLAETLHRLGRLEEALRAWQQVIAVVPGRADVYINQGNVLYDLQRYEEALARYTRALQRAPHNTFAHRQAGRALLQLARYEEAFAAFEQAVRLAPYDAPNIVGQGIALEALGQYDQAIAAYSHALQLDPGSERLTLHAGHLMLRQRGKRLSLALAGRVLALNERNHGAWLIQGEALLGIGSYEGALSAYERAVQIRPNDPRGYLGESRALACLGRHPEADEMLERARELEE